jgi:hypothetical protein
MYATMSTVTKHGFVTDPALCDQTGFGIFRDDGQCVMLGSLCIRRRPSSTVPFSFPDRWPTFLFVTSLLLSRHSDLLDDS